MKPLKVLIVENSEDDAILVLDCLRRYGYDPDWKIVETAPDFIAALASEPWDLILSDYMMPSFTGLEALSLCRGAGFLLPFILVSGSIGEERAVEALHSGADDYVMKDRIQRLSAAVDRALREAKARQDSLRAEAEIRRLNAELESKVDLLSRSNQELEQFATVASHDLKEPLRTVTMYTQLLLRRKAGTLHADESEFADFIRGGVERMRSLIDGLLAYSRISRQPAGLAVSADANLAVGDALVALQGAIEVSGATVTMEDLPSVAIEPFLLTQVFQNLIANAIKYRRLEESPRIHISASNEEGKVQFHVRDNGIGVSPTHYDRIFILFRRLHGEEYPGIGLGLALCKRIVEQRNGRIWIESERGVGSTFHFTLEPSTAVTTVAESR